MRDVGRSREAGPRDTRSRARRPYRFRLRRRDEGARDALPEAARAGWSRPALQALIGGLALVLAACSPWRDIAPTRPPDLSTEWKGLLDELRTFERTLGFRETPNFTRLSFEREAYDYCGWTSRHALPYSYEDPAIHWLEPADYARCREAAPDHDWEFGSVEVLGEIGTPVTPSMIAGHFERFVYLVIHEDCHDQFELPYGIEEPLCNILTYHAMARFAAQKYPWFSRENRSLRHYGSLQRRQTRATVVHYGELERLYARYQKRELMLEALLASRAVVFARLERALEYHSGAMNNIGVASLMTYSRHYGYLEDVVNRVGPDLARVVDFFREADAATPKPEALMQRLGIRSRTSLDFVRAYEQAALEAIERSLGTPLAAARPD